MELGLSLPQFGPTADPSRVADFARTAEELGFDSLWVGDRLLTPTDPSDLYPSGPRPYPPEFTTAADPLITWTAAAVATSRVRLNSSTFNGPWYNGPQLARALTTIDVLSGGRLDVGLGIGWMRDEYRTSAADWDTRGRRLDELLDLLHAWWTTNPVEHHGAVFDVPESVVDLRPVQRGGPPIWLGGFSSAALRRVGRRATGWLPVAGTPTEVVDRLWEVARRAADAAGRDPDQLRRAVRINPRPGTSVDQLLSQVDELADAGNDGAFVELGFLCRSVDEMVEWASALAQRRSS